MPRRVITGFLLVALGLAAWGLGEARSDPVVRRARVRLPGWPAGAAPMRVALVSDLHLGDLATDAARLDRVADRVTALRPDLVLVAGDFVAGLEPGSSARAAPALTAALRRLRAPMGVVAVPGNHDHITGLEPVARAAARAGVAMLRNGAVRRGPLVVGGLDDPVTGHARLAETLAAMRRLGGVPVLLSHSPDPAADVARGLVLAGHTHCGQVVPPLLGAPVSVSRYGERYRCGMRREGARLVVTTAGTGTSDVPVRWGARPDVWVLELGP